MSEENQKVVLFTDNTYLTKPELEILHAVLEFLLLVRLHQFLGFQMTRFDQFTPLLLDTFQTLFEEFFTTLTFLVGYQTF